ncbi:YbaB/EbfC family nucleoid-associated protein [Nocardia sp. CA-290969]|uniref:YbaB/EbfC family nucleoid-associated protein n=1 Tax=Nocardia sp. CA-290969 TaxID=3239986 RepID=UPI003D920CBA
MFDDPSATAAGLAQWAEQMQRKTQRFQVLQDRLAQLSVTETAADNSVQVTIDSNGLPTDIRFTDGIRRKSPATLSTEVMACLSRARAALVSRVTATVHDVVGDDPIGANIVDQLGRRLADPDPVPDPARPTQPPVPSPPRPGPSVPIWSDQPQQTPVWNQQPAPPAPTWQDPAPNRTEPARPAPTWPEATQHAPAPATPQPPRQEPAPPPPADPKSLIPDDEDPEGEYYRRASWLV